MPTLHDKLTLPSGLVLPNRLAKAPMTENLADRDNQPTERHERAYRRWAEGGAGLLITGNLMVDRRYLERSRNIVADRHLDVARLARIRDASGAVSTGVTTAAPISAAARLEVHSHRLPRPARCLPRALRDGSVSRPGGVPVAAEVMCAM